jgi:4-hydroxy 2-oxovalerate aldolase
MNWETDKDIIVQQMNRIKTLGYDLYVQAVDSLSYNDKELLEIIDVANRIVPKTFSIVDTYGAMYIDDVSRLYNLVNHNLKPDISIGFHSHNNFQLSFSFAQEIIRLGEGKRDVIIDTTLDGMGKAAGNLATELLADYMDRILAYNYDIEKILDIVDKYVVDWHQKYQWGYSPTYLMSGIFRSHPNNVAYLTKKFRMDIKDIRNVLGAMQPSDLKRYDYDKLDLAVQKYNDSKYDDSSEVSKLKEVVRGRIVLVLAPGTTLATHADVIDAYIRDHKPLVISVNHYDRREKSYAFFANKRRYYSEDESSRQTIVTSNIAKYSEAELLVNYSSLVISGCKMYDNSTVMLLNLLSKLNVDNVAVAGFDGFSHKSKNYFDEDMDITRLGDSYDAINEEIKSALSVLLSKVEKPFNIKFITPSMFELP